MAEITDPSVLSQLNASGADFLKTLDPSRASMVRALAEGRQGLPAGYSMRSPLGQQLLADVAQYDPSFDAANLPARVAARKAFTSGAQGKNITSFNTAIGHLGTLAEQSEKLDNSGFTLWNSLANAAETAAGDPRVTNFNTAKQAVVDELERAFKGTGGNVHEIKQWEETLNSSRSPEQLRGAIKIAADLLGSRIGAMRDSYNEAMGTTDQPLPMLNQHASDALDKFKSNDYLAKGYGAISAPDGAPPSNDGGAAPLPGETPPSGPIDPGGEGDIGFNQASAPVAAFNDQQQAAYDAFLKANPSATADQLRAFGQSIGVGIGNADDIVSARDKGAGVAPASTAVFDTTKAQTPDLAGSAALGFGNALTFGTLPKAGAAVDAIASKVSGDPASISDIYRADLAQNNATVANAQANHPLASLAGNVAGFIGGDAAISAIPGVARLAARIPGTLRPLAGDALYGAVYGAGSSDNIADAPGAALKGAAFAGAGGVLGRRAVSGVAALASPVANAAVRRLTDAGVTLTPGQILGANEGILGRFAKGAEDRLSGFPGVGDFINTARRSGTEDFNRAAINDALRPIGGTAGGVGHGGVADARRQVGDAYTDALGQMQALPDQQLTADLQAVNSRVQTLSQSHQDQFANIMDTDLQPYLNGRAQLDGADLQAIKQGLDGRIANLRGQGSTPQDRDLADRLDDTLSAILDNAGRSNPSASEAFQRANEAYSMLSRVEGAAAKAKDGIFTPNQFRQAVTKRGYGTTTASVASGSSRMQQLATDASTVLPSTVPDSGTAGRVALGALLAGSPGAALGGAEGYRQQGLEGALVGAALGSAAFSRPGLQVTQRVLAGSRGRTLNTLGDWLRANSALGGAIGTPLLLDRSK
jgi:hypothetical protein